MIFDEEVKFGELLFMNIEVANCFKKDERVLFLKKDNGKFKVTNGNKMLYVWPKDLYRKKDKKRKRKDLKKGDLAILNSDIPDSIFKKECVVKLLEDSGPVFTKVSLNDTYDTIYSHRLEPYEGDCIELKKKRREDLKKGDKAILNSNIPYSSIYTKGSIVELLEDINYSSPDESLTNVSIDGHNSMDIFSYRLDPIEEECKSETNCNIEYIVYSADHYFNSLENAKQEALSRARLSKGKLFKVGVAIPKFIMQVKEMIDIKEL